MSRAKSDSNKGNGTQVYTTVEVAKLCNVTQRAVIYWIEQGRLSAYRTPGGHRRITEDDLKTFMDAYRIPVGDDSDPRRQRRILVVDDSAEFVDMIRRMIRLIDDRYEVATAGSGFDAGVMVCRWQPELIVLDVLLPEMDGYEVCRTLKSDDSTRGIIVVAISGSPDPEMRRRILACGADEFVAKPLDAGALRELLGRYVPV